MRTLHVMAVVASVWVAPGLARAEESGWEGSGHASIVNADRVRARERALDEAMRQAVSQAVAQTLAPQLGPGGEATLASSVYPRARQFVTSYRILEEAEQGNLLRLKIVAQVATDRIAQMVLGKGGGAAAKRKVLVCVADAAGGPAIEKRVMAALGARGLEATASRTGCDAAAADDGAARLARGAEAQAVLVVDARAEATGVIRGTAQKVAAGRATLRLAGADGSAGAATGEAEAWHSDAAEAVTRAAADALDAAMTRLEPAFAARFPSGGPAGGEARVRVVGAAAFQDLVAMQRTLAVIPGVSAVVPQKYGPAGVELAVRTQLPAGGIAAALARGAEGYRFGAAIAPDGALEVRIEPAPPPVAPDPAAPPPAGTPAPAPAPGAPPG